MVSRDSVIAQLRDARRYTKNMLDSVREELWFWMPAEGVTHVGWQVGHLAVAQYSLCLKRLRGELASDVELIAPDFRKLFGKGSQPDNDANIYPETDEIRSVFDSVFDASLEAVQGASEDALNAATDGPPHPMFRTKLEALQWCAHHEFIHAGQIAILRRLSGEEPLR